MRLTLCCSLIGVVFFARTASADPVLFLVSESDTHVQFNITENTQLPATKTFTFSKVTTDGYWAIFVNVTEDTGTTFDPNDKVSITGTITHVLSPVGHSDGGGFPIPVNLLVNANNATGSPEQVKAHEQFPIAHGPHYDNYIGDLTANVKTTFVVVDSILSYTATLVVDHSAEGWGWHSQRGG